MVVWAKAHNINDKWYNWSAKLQGLNYNSKVTLTNLNE
jgi:hypothetical protein